LGECQKLPGADANFPRGKVWRVTGGTIASASSAEKCQKMGKDGMRTQKTRTMPKDEHRPGKLLLVPHKPTEPRKGKGPCREGTPECAS